MANYHEEQNRQNILRLREHLKVLPPFLGEFFRNRADYTSTRTRLGYAYDLKLFFNFLINETRDFGDLSIDSFALEDLGRINADHIEEFMEYLSYYITNRDREGAEYSVQNKMEGKSRKLSAVRSMLAYFYKKGKIAANPAELVATPPVKERAKVYLDANEIANLLDEADSGEHLTKKQRDYHNHTRCRDVAILSLFVGTGVRISEAVGLNLEDVDIENGCFKVIRKGGDEAILYFGEEVEDALAQYLETRLKITPKPGHERAFFLSMQNRRITVRAVQNLVKKYSFLANSLKKITPHKLRTSFGTNMYRQTGDIYLVADLLGHKDVNTTRKSYADTKGEAGRRAVRELRLRGDE
ncbi:MAG: tyrosine-type recombinase/integrase [Defluviitaleaceae bacterium]|nr:tyrosine-type recombinase/integrase [Defluviitaleaceae bacterium]